jgi:predicted ester cyclase
VSTTTENKAFIKRYAEHGIVEVMKGNPDAIHEYMHDHYVRHTGTHQEHGATNLDGFKADVKDVMDGFPDMRFEVGSLVAEGDLVAAHWTLRGKHTGRHRHRHTDGHIEGTGADAHIAGITIYRLQDGKIAESWGYDNHLDFLIGAGALTISRKD